MIKLIRNLLALPFRTLVLITAIITFLNKFIISVIIGKYKEFVKHIKFTNKLISTFCKKAILEKQNPTVIMSMRLLDKDDNILLAYDKETTYVETKRIESNIYFDKDDIEV